MKQIVCKRFWGLPIRIVLTDEALAKDEATAMVSHCNGTFEASFRGCQSIAAVVHETYHLFMDMLEFVELEPKAFGELTSEAYAYTFEELFNLVHDTLFGMKLYRKMWNEQKEETC